MTHLYSLDITIGFSTTNKWLSRVIRWVTRGRVSHAWIAFYDSSVGTRLVMQAEAWGYEVRPWHRWKHENILVAEFQPQKQLDGSLRWIARSLGTKYDWTSALFAGLRRWLGRWVKGRFRSPKKLMCSEAVIRFLRHGNTLAVLDLDPETTSPARLLQVVEATPEFRKVSK
jgi:hypothetical protein